jgi:hypothetical protein
MQVIFVYNYVYYALSVCIVCTLFVEYSLLYIIPYEGCEIGFGACKIRCEGAAISYYSGSMISGRERTNHTLTLYLRVGSLLGTHPINFSGENHLVSQQTMISSIIYIVFTASS